MSDQPDKMQQPAASQPDQMATGRAGQQTAGRGFAPRRQRGFLPSPRLVPASVLLLGLCMILAGAVTVWIIFSTDDENIEVTIQSVALSTAGEMEIIGASYTGRTSSGNDFEITADLARETSGQAELIDLVSPVGRLNRAGGSQLQVTAANGVMNSQSRDMDLAGSVVVTDSRQGLVLRTEHLVARLNDGFLSSPGPVALNTADLNIRAAGMTATDDGRHIVFNGPSRLVQLRQETVQ